MDGMIATCEVYVGEGGSCCGSTAAAGESMPNKMEQEVRFDETRNGRYTRLVALSNINLMPWTGAAELNVIGRRAAGSHAKYAAVTDFCEGTDGESSFDADAAPRNDAPPSAVWTLLVQRQHR